MIKGIRNRLIQLIYKGDNQIGLTNIRYLPRWIVLMIDVFILIFSMVLTYLLLENLNIKHYQSLTIFEQFALLFILNTIFFFVFKTYSGLIRHSTFTDIAKMVLASFSTLFFASLINYSFFYITGKKIYLIPGLVFYAFFSFSLLLI